MPLDGAILGEGIYQPSEAARLIGVKAQDVLRKSNRFGKLIINSLTTRRKSPSPISWNYASFGHCDQRAFRFRQSALLSIWHNPRSALTARYRPSHSRMTDGKY